MATASTEIDPSKPDAEIGTAPDYVVKPEVIYCSDAISISTPATNIDAIWLCEAAARIVNHLCYHGFLVRGAIETGELYHSSNTIFGPAIVRAVKAERDNRRPVIVVSSETLQSFKHAETSRGKEIVAIREYQLIGNENGLPPFIDPFWLSKIHTDRESISAPTRLNLESWRVLIDHGLRNLDCKIRMKYLWMAHWFNRSLCNKASGIRSITPQSVLGRLLSRARRFWKNRR